jgi:Resolvase, N terminal domain
MPTPEFQPAVAYYRMSTDRQDMSIKEQRDQLRRYAIRNGYCITREYSDEGISGDATHKRKEFQRLIRDAVEAGRFKVILSWDIDRFGRFDALEAGYWIWPLRERGIRLVTIAQGEVNWESFTGRILYAIEQEGKHSYLRDLSRNVARGLGAFNVANDAREHLCRLCDAHLRSAFSRPFADSRCSPGNSSLRLTHSFGFCAVEVLHVLFSSSWHLGTRLQILCFRVRLDRPLLARRQIDAFERYT